MEYKSIEQPKKEEIIAESTQNGAEIKMDDEILKAPANDTCVVGKSEARGDITTDVIINSDVTNLV